MHLRCSVINNVIRVVWFLKTKIIQKVFRTIVILRKLAIIVSNKLVSRCGTSFRGGDGMPPLPINTMFVSTTRSRHSHRHVVRVGKMTSHRPLFRVVPICFVVFLFFFLRHLLLLVQLLLEDTRSWCSCFIVGRAVRGGRRRRRRRGGPETPSRGGKEMPHHCANHTSS